MSHDGAPLDPARGPILTDLTATTRAALPAVDAVLEAAKAAVASLVTDGDRVSARLVEAHQTAAHGLAWLATYAQALHRMQDWADQLTSAGTFGETEQLILQIAFGEYLAQIDGGIQMNQGEVVRLTDLGLTAPSRAAFAQTDAVQTLCAQGNTQAARTRLVALMQDQSADLTVGRSGLDEELEMVRDQFRRFSRERVEPYAHDWHLNDDLIPMEIIDEMAEMGVFGLTIPENLGGFGLSKSAMCVVSEELSRGYIGVGSLGTRSEIAAELILCGGTDDQKSHWLPRIATSASTCRSRSRAWTTSCWTRARPGPMVLPTTRRPKSWSPCSRTISRNMCPTSTTT